MSFIPVVCRCGHRCSYRCRSSKVDATDLDAFASPNLRPLVTVGVDYEVSWDTVLLPPVGDLEVDTRFEEKVVVVSLFPGTFPGLTGTRLQSQHYQQRPEVTGGESVL